MSRHNIELSYKFVKSKGCYMWLYIDTGYYNKYQYIFKTVHKPTKREFRKRKQWCIDQCKSWYEWDHM